MTGERYKKAYNKERERSKKMVDFIEAITDATQEFDLLCDCTYSDGPSEPIERSSHDPECMTMKARYDAQQAMEYKE